ncbi:MAG: hypothetical protein KAS32_14335 [Candidatus Peribacteraceae bacterium]|nr:hypothetical protein [Candidatus Peribacteraceae bacterium]
MSIKEYSYERVDYHNIISGEFSCHDDPRQIPHKIIEKENIINSLWYRFSEGCSAYLLVMKDGIRVFEYSNISLDNIDTMIDNHLKAGKTIEEALELTLLLAL